MAISFSSLGNPAPIGNLLIVDGLNIAFRWKHQGVTDFKYDYARTVESLAKSYNAGTIIITADGGSSYRKAIFPEYKANRKEKYAEQTPQEEKEFEMFMAEFSNTLTLLKEKHTVLQFKGGEADDIAAYISMNLDEFKDVCKEITTFTLLRNYCSIDELKERSISEWWRIKPVINMTVDAKK